MTTSLQVLNCSWDRTTVWHNCVQDPVTGQRCCKDEVAAREKVNGWRASGRRIQEIIAEKKAAAAGHDVGFELRETTGTELGDR